MKYTSLSVSKVNVQESYQAIIRYKDPANIKSHIEIAKFLLDSGHVIFGSENRLALKNYIKSIGYTNYQKISKDKECDDIAFICLCSTLVGILGIKDWNNITVIDGYKDLSEYVDIYYNTDIQFGDIVIYNDGSAAIVTDIEIDEQPIQEKAIKNEIVEKEIIKNVLVKPQKSSQTIRGIYIVIKDTAMRFGPSEKYDIIRNLKPNDIVMNYTFYTRNWLFVKDNKGNKGYVNRKDLISR